MSYCKLKNTKRIIDYYYNNNYTFRKLHNYGNYIDNELVKICKKYDSFLDTNILSNNILDFCKIENVSNRSINVCKNGEIKTVFELLKYYNKEKSFKKIRNCGDKSNNELIAVCKKYITYKVNLQVNKELPVTITKTIKLNNKLKEVLSKYIGFY